MRMDKWTCSLAVAFAAVLMFTARAADVPPDNAPPDNAKAAGPAQGQGQGRRGGAPGGGGMRGGGMFGGGMFGGPGGAGGMANRLDQALGLDVPVKLEQLPYGPAQRFVTRVPVGGVDSLQDRGNGWKVEEVFTLTAEQAKALETVRAQYQEEQAKLQKQLDETLKPVADQAKALREKYELLANDVLTGPAKDEKAKLDALAKEFSEQRGVAAKEQQPKATDLAAEFEKTLALARVDGNFQALRDIGTKAQELISAFNDARKQLVKDVTAKMEAAVTGDAKTKLEAAFKKVEDQQQRQFQGFRQGGRGQGQTPNQKPPTAPDGNF